MPRVICNLPNASTEISGVKFHPLEDGGLVSDEIGAELAASFLTIPGYESYDTPAPAALEPAKAEPAAPKTRKAAAAPKKATEPPAAPLEPVVEQPAVETLDPVSGAPADEVF